MNADEPRTHYQITFTARQAAGGFLVLLLSLGLAYYLGLMSGLSGRGSERGVGDRTVEPETVAGANAAEASGEDLPPIETAVPTAAVPEARLGSRTLLAGGGPMQTPLPAEPTPPATLQTFEDASSETGEGENVPTTEASGVGSPAAAKPARAAAEGSGRFWVQVASLSSREEAGTLSTRLSRRGFRSQVQTAAGPRGKGKIYRVRVGPYRSEDDAERAASKLERQENVKSPWVVPDGM